MVKDLVYKNIVPASALQASSLVKEVNFSCKPKAKKRSSEGEDEAPLPKQLKSSEVQGVIDFSKSKSSEKETPHEPETSLDSLLLDEDSLLTDASEVHPQTSTPSKEAVPPQHTESTDTSAPSTSTSHHCDITSICHRSPPVPETPVPETPVPETPVTETPVPETPLLYPKDLENLLLSNQSLLKEIHQKVTSLQLPTSGVNLLPPPPEVSSKPIVHASTIEGIKKSRNIIDLLEVPNLNFSGRHVSENSTSFTIKCETCFLYVQNAVTAGKMKKAGSSFASGHILDENAFTMFKFGNACPNARDRQRWLNFKQSIVQHLNSAVHSSAVEFDQTHSKQRRRDLKVTHTIIAATLTCVRSKLAAHHFPPMLSMLHGLGVDVGNIGHSRYLNILLS